jgi:hypothetical protein
MARTRAERIANVEKEMAELANLKKRLLQEKKAQERKARTKRLIERGLILESMLPNPELLTNEQVKEFLKIIMKTDFAKQELKKLAIVSGESVTEKQGSMSWHIGAAAVQNEADVAEPAEM